MKRTRSRISLGWDDIDADALRTFEKTSFEHLCRDLVLIELRDRHHASASLQGPPEEDRPGADLRVSITATPGRSLAAYQDKWTLTALTTDEPCVTVYSCKTGSTWARKVKDEAKNRSQWALEALRGGGRLTILINKPRNDNDHDRRTLEHSLAVEYRNRMHGEDMPSLADIERRIRVLDANHIAAFLRGRRPLMLRPRFREMLGCRTPRELKSLDEWQAIHEDDRGDPGFGNPMYEWDESREAMRDRLLECMSLERGGVAWLVGRPGVGKTRLLIELLGRHEEVAQRTLVAVSAADGLQVLRDGLFERFPKAILIIDDCPERELDRIAEWLPGRGAGSVIAITPMSESVPPSALVAPRFREHRVPLEPMARAARERLIGQILSDPDDVRRVADVTEGYPWFATLVAHEIAYAREARSEVALPRTPAEAAQFALCSRHEDAWQEIVWRRARVLFLALLTEDTDWDTLDQSERETLCQAVGLRDWVEVRDTFRDCERRGLVRTRLRGAFKYVTPSILAREVIRMLLDPTPGGPAPLGPHLREHAGPYLPRFYERLAGFGLKEDTLALLARPIVDALDAGQSSTVTRAELAFAEHHADPRRLARIIGGMVDRRSVEELRGDASFRDLVLDVLVSLAHRERSFERAESALFRLAVADPGHSWDRATPRWAELFLIEGGQTYRSFADRLAILRHRCTSDEYGAAGRSTALEGLLAALDRNFVSLWYPAPASDGPFVELTRTEAHDARRDAWMLLLDAMEDPDPDVATRAARIATRALGPVASTDFDESVAERLAATVPRLSEADQRHVRRSVEDAYARLFPDSPAELSAEPSRACIIWSRLKESLSPRSFSERLRHHVGSYSWTHDDDATDLDRELAREGLQPPERPILPECTWLVSGQDAERGAAFGMALGREDREGVALAHLLERPDAPGASNVVSAYLLGWKEDGREAAVDRWLRESAHDSTMLGIVTMTLFRLGATDERIEVLLDLLERESFNEAWLDLFARGSWERDASDESLAKLVHALERRGSTPARELALGLLVTRGRRQPETVPFFRTHLESALSALARAQQENAPLQGGMAVRWQRGCELLMSTDSDVSELLLEALRHGSPVLGKTSIWRAFERWVTREPHRMWRALKGLYEEHGIEEARRLGRGMAGHRIVERLESTEIMDWVARDPERATWVATMIPMDTDELPGLARDLITRFGPDAPCSDVLLDALSLPQGLVGSLAEFLGERIARVRAWRETDDGRIRDWADSVLDDLEPRYERHDAHEEYEATRWRAITGSS